MKVIGNLIKEALQEYELFPDNVKEELKSEMKNLISLKDIKILNYRMTTMRNLIK